jgi:nitroreductase
MKDGVYLYDADDHALMPVLAGDFRSEIMMTPPPRPKDAGGPLPPPPPPPSHPPIQIVLVSDISRIRHGPPELKPEWGAIDAGIVSQNISLFCAATGIMTRPRASVEKQRVKDLLGLTDSHHVFLNHPIGYPKQGVKDEHV